MATSTQTLKARPREAVGTRACRRLRATGDVPGVVYGHQEQAVPILVSRDELDEVVRRRARMVDMVLGDKTETVLLKEVQYDALGDDIVHADFMRVAMDETVTIEVTIRLKGAPKVEHAVLQQTLGELEVECLPANIPDEIIALVGDLQIGQTLHVGELQVPPGVKVLTDPEVIVAALTAAAEEEPVAAAAPEGEGAEPEVIGRKAEAEEGEEGEEEEKPKPKAKEKAKDKE